MATIRGTFVSDLLNGTASADIINGLTGNDTLAGFGGDDILHGRSGDDHLHGFGGSDLMVGGKGHDIYVVNDAGDIVIEAPQSGIDTVKSRIGYQLTDNVENLILIGTHDLSGTGNGEGNNLIGNRGHNRLKGLGGDDTIHGGGGNDTLNGNRGQDHLHGGLGADRLAGGAGDDTLVWDSADQRVNGGMGADTVKVTAGDLDLTAIPDGKIRNVEGVDLGRGSHSLTLAYSDVLAISGTTDTLRVSGSADDAVDAGAGWTRIADITIGTATYAQYRQGGATLQVDLDIAFAAKSLARLDGTNGFRLDGIDTSDLSGSSVAAAGDVNGDGLADFIIGAPGADRSGESYVVFGATSFGSSVDLGALDGANGFRLDGIDARDNSGRSVASAGDVNGDGLADLLIGALSADPGGKSFAGESYVVFGRTSFGSSVDLGALDGTNGFRLDGIDAGDQSGFSVAAAGDVNGDGYTDLLIGAVSADPGGKSYAGESYVVFGGTSFGSSVDLGALDGTNGFRLDGIDASDLSGRSVAAAGDVNGDGLADLIIGAPGADRDAGESYVVFGATSFGSSMDLGALDGANGFRLDGIEAKDRTGSSVASAGDVNGDGLADLIIGAPGTDRYAGASYVVFGATSFASSVDLGALDGTNGFRLDGIDARDHSGSSVAAAGDVNGDGLADLIIGAPGPDRYAGESYVVFGATSFASSVDLGALDGTNGFRLQGIDANDRSGSSVAAAGDVNGDGFADLLIGAHTAHPGGESYVIYGGDFTGAVTHLGTGGADALAGTAAAETFVAGGGGDTMTGGGGADVFRGGAGNDVVRVSSVAFADVDGGSGTDTLALTGSGMTLDLTALADRDLTGIETIDLTGSGGNSLVLELSDLLNLSDTSNRLTVEGNSGDAVAVADGTWSDGGEVGGYHIYELGAATLRIDAEITSVTITT